MFFSISLIFALQSVFLTKLVTPDILFSTTVNADVVAKPLILGILLTLVSHQNLSLLLNLLVLILQQIIFLWNY